MELYINSTWTKRYENTYVAEAIAHSENGNHAVIYATGESADKAEAKLMNALNELKLISGTPSPKDNPPPESYRHSSER